MPLRGIVDYIWVQAVIQTAGSLYKENGKVDIFPKKQGAMHQLSTLNGQLHNKNQERNCQEIDRKKQDNIFYTTDLAAAGGKNQSVCSKFFISSIFQKLLQ